MTKSLTTIWYSLRWRRQTQIVMSEDSTYAITYRCNLSFKSQLTVYNLSAAGCACELQKSPPKPNSPKLPRRIAAAVRCFLSRMPLNEENVTLDVITPLSDAVSLESNEVLCIQRTFVLMHSMSLKHNSPSRPRPCSHALCPCPFSPEAPRSLNSICLNRASSRGSKLARAPASPSIKDQGYPDAASTLGRVSQRQSRCLSLTSSKALTLFHMPQATRQYISVNLLILLLL